MKAASDAAKILVIDDEEAVLQSCRRVFEGSGYEVTTATAGVEGLALAGETKYDVIICDWMMPGLDGMDVVRELDKRSPESAVVMVSGYPSTDRATEAMARGALEYLAKPFGPDEILRAVDRARRRKAEQEKKTMERAHSVARSLQFPTPDLDDKSPSTIAETVATKVGVGKVTSPWRSVLVLGLLGGAYIAFGGVLATSVSFDLAARMGTGFARFMAGSAFSLGLILVVVAGAELFTGNNLMISSVMAGGITLGRMLERWGLVYVANFLGAVLVALLFVLSGLWKNASNAVGAAAVAAAYSRVNQGFWEALVRGIGCNWLVCLAVWMAMASRQTIGKILAIYFPIMAFVAIGFEHCVANMYFVPAGLFLKSIAGLPAPEGMLAGALTWGSFFLKSLLPVTIGNIVGGAVFVGMSYWGAYLLPSNRA